jgi:hypothetical protein
MSVMASEPSFITSPYGVALQSRLSLEFGGVLSQDPLLSDTLLSSALVSLFWDKLVDSVLPTRKPQVQKLLNEWGLYWGVDVRSLESSLYRLVECLERFPTSMLPPTARVARLQLARLRWLLPELLKLSRNDQVSKTLGPCQPEDQTVLAGMTTEQHVRSLSVALSILAEPPKNTSSDIGHVKIDIFPGSNSVQSKFQKQQVKYHLRLESPDYFSQEKSARPFAVSAQPAGNMVAVAAQFVAQETRGEERCALLPKTFSKTDAQPYGLELSRGRNAKWNTHFTANYASKSKNIQVFCHSSHQVRVICHRA